MAEEIEAVGRHRLFQRTIGILAPARQQTIKTDRIDHSARKNMRPDFRPLLDQNHRKLRIDLLQPDRSRQTRRTPANNHNVIVHPLALGELGVVGHRHSSSML